MIETLKITATTGDVEKDKVLNFLKFKPRPVSIPTPSAFSTPLNRSEIEEYFTSFKESESFKDAKKAHYHIIMAVYILSMLFLTKPMLTLAFPFKTRPQRCSTLRMTCWVRRTRASRRGCSMMRRRI